MPVLSRASGSPSVAQLDGQSRRGALADPAAGPAGHPEMQLAAEEGAGGEDDRPRREPAVRPARTTPATRRPSIARALDFALDDLEPLLSVEQTLDGRLVTAVGPPEPVGRAPPRPCWH